MATTRIIPQPEDATALVVSVQHTGTRSVQKMLREQGHIVMRCHVDQEPEQHIMGFKEVHVPMRDPAACYQSTLNRSGDSPEKCLCDVVNRYRKLAAILAMYHNRVVLHRMEDGFEYLEGVYKDQPSQPTSDPEVLRRLHGFRCQFGYQEAQNVLSGRT